MWATIRNPLIRNLAIRNPAHNYRLVCIRPSRAARSLDGGARGLLVNEWRTTHPRAARPCC
eukprot:12236557-Alexandrium_andersonii.AAC.1